MTHPVGDSQQSQTAAELGFNLEAKAESYESSNRPQIASPAEPQFNEEREHSFVDKSAQVDALMRRYNR